MGSNGSKVVKALLLIFLLFILFTSYTPRAFKAKLNVINSRSVQLGMSETEVVTIMGSPAKVYYKDDKMLYYEPPFGASDGIYFIIDSTAILKQIIPFE